MGLGHGKRILLGGGASALWHGSDMSDLCFCGDLGGEGIKTWNSDRTRLSEIHGLSFYERIQKLVIPRGGLHDAAFANAGPVGFFCCFLVMMMITRCSNCCKPSGNNVLN